VAGSRTSIAAHGLKVALVHPQIAPNTGQVGRLCVASGAELHLIRPLGFVLSDRQLKRAGMDYWKRVKLTVHDDEEAFLKAVGGERVWLFENGEERSVWDAEFASGDWLVFGSETKGLPQSLAKNWPGRVVAIPQVAGERCLNLASAVSIGVYEAIRQIGVGL
jgi:tRNA (cytidine/uridine-2'-O-)-methyltransferase